MFVCLFAGWLSAHWEEITHLCVRFGFSLFGSGHWEETKETTWSFITTVWCVGSVHLGRDDYYYYYALVYKIWAQNFGQCCDSHIRICWPLDFGLNFTLCVHMDGWMDGWACSSNLSQHLLSQFNIPFS
jgi:hypothetical protein